MSFLRRERTTLRELPVTFWQKLTQRHSIWAQLLDRDSMCSSLMNTTCSQHHDPLLRSKGTGRTHAPEVDGAEVGEVLLEFVQVDRLVDFLLFIFDLLICPSKGYVMSSAQGEEPGGNVNQ